VRPAQKKFAAPLQAAALKAPHCRSVLRARKKRDQAYYEKGYSNDGGQEL
jgi:hypothetical protein